MTEVSGKRRLAPSKEHTDQVALVIASMAGGGAERAVAKLASGFVRRGQAVDLVLARAEGPFMAELDPAVRIIDLGARRMASAVLPLSRYLRAERPAVVLSALDYVNVTTLAAVALSRVDVPVVVSERNTLSAALTQSTGLRSRWLPQLIRWAYPRADAVIAVSEGVADDLQQVCGLARSSIHVLNNPVVTKDVLRMREESMSHPWPPSSSSKVVLAAGRLIPQKDFATLIEAFAQVRRTRCASLVILGEGPLRTELEQLAEQRGVRDDVFLPGFAENPYPAMCAADVFVLSSRWEGSPGVLIEAMSCGTPVVATDCPSGPRQILEDGRYGRLVPPGDVTAIAEGLLDAFDGQVPPPPPDSLLPYHEEQAVTRYLELLLGLVRS